MKVIKKGSKGNAVKVWQIIVGANPDGRFGSGTEGKTIAWQKNHGLTPDGIVGKNTWKAGLESLQKYDRAGRECYYMMLFAGFFKQKFTIYKTNVRIYNKDTKEKRSKIH